MQLSVAMLGRHNLRQLSESPLEAGTSRGSGLGDFKRLKLGQESLCEGLHPLCAAGRADSTCTVACTTLAQWPSTAQHSMAS